MKNNFFTIGLNKETGNVNSIVINDDPDSMNWCGMTHEWGELVCENRVIQTESRWTELVDFTENESESVSKFTNGKLDITVK